VKTIRPAIALALIAALMAGGAAAATKSSASKSKPKSKTAAAADPVLVRIGKETITQGDVQRRIESLPEQFRSNYATPEGRQQLLDRMIEEKVWMAKANQNGVPNRPQVKQQLDQQRRDLIIRTYLNDVMATNPAVSDSEAHEFYEQHEDDYRVPATVTLKHIQLKKESDAKKVVQQARAKNAKWDDLVKKWSVDTLTRTTGGSLGTVTKEGQFASIGAQPALAESAFTLEQGQVGGPWKTDKGWHVVKVETLKPETVRSFEQVKPIITRQIGSQRQQDFYKTKLDEARKSLGVKPDSAAIRSFVSQKKTPREMFNEAQTLSSPQARIDAYESLLRQYPQSEVSPQAQFMIGFIHSEELKNYDAAEQAFRKLLQTWPKAELAASAQWMIDHMRSEDVPAFVDLDADSAKAGSKHASPGTKSPHERDRDKDSGERTSKP